MQLAFPMQNYVVQEGDDLSMIAERAGASLQAVLDLNNIADPDLVFPGMVVVLPMGVTTF
jgi:spore germination protein